MLTQTTGREHRNLIAQLPVVTEGIDPRLSQLVHLTANIYYMASYNAHTAASLMELDKYIDGWISAAQVVVQLGIRPNLNIPKIHSLFHYTAAFRRFGSSDNYNTEVFERRHIDDVKKGYRSSNRREYLPQITKGLERNRKIEAFWRRLARQGLLSKGLRQQLLHHDSENTSITGSLQGHTADDPISIEGMVGMMDEGFGEIVEEPEDGLGGDTSSFGLEDEDDRSNDSQPEWVNNVRPQPDS
jgi:hypothetical protein